MARTKLSENIAEESSLARYEREMHDVLEELKLKYLDDNEDDDERGDDYEDNIVKL